MLQGLLQAVLLVTAVSVDAFVCSFAYGAKNIKILLPSVLVIVGIGGICMFISLFAGEAIRPFLTEEVAKIFGFLILFFLGVVKLLDNVLKSIIKRRNKLDKQIKFKLLSLNFILNIYANPEDADYDRSMTLSPKEAVALAVAVSIDVMAAGMGSALSGDTNKPLIITLTLFIGYLAVKLGFLFGNKIARKMKHDFTWISGAGLITLAFMKLL